MTFFQPRRAERSPEGLKFGLVSFVDMLGFSAASKKLPRNEIKTLINSRGELRASAAEFIGAPPLDRDFIMFQDTMVRCVEIGYMPEGLPEKEQVHHLGNWLYALMDELASLRELQLSFIDRDTPLRGAIAVGRYDVAENVVWGSAYERAAALESSIADYPRIIMDEFLCGFLEYAKKAKAEWVLENIRTDDLGISFVDYLRGIAFECPSDLSLFGVKLGMHKRFIKAGLHNHSNDAILRKLTWLAAYHNAVVDDLSEKRPREPNWEEYRL
jgi:hypothetical protein